MNNNVSSQSFSNLLDEELQTHLHLHSTHPILAKLHFISCSNLFLFQFQTNYFYPLIRFLLNHFEDFKCLNLKNSFTFFNKFNLFSDKSINHNQSNNNNMIENTNQNHNIKLNEFLNELYLICSQFNDKNITRCLEINGIQSDPLHHPIENDLARFELLKNLVIIFNVDESELI